MSSFAWSVGIVKLGSYTTTPQLAPPTSLSKKRGVPHAVASASVWGSMVSGR